MTRRIFATALASAAVFTAVLGVPAPADDPTPTPSPVASAVDTPAVTETAAPTQAPTQAPTDTPAQAPTDTPTQTPTDTPTQAPTDTPTETPTQTQTPTQTAPPAAPTDTSTSTPAPTGTSTASPTATATAPHGGHGKHSRPANQSTPKTGQARACTSSSDRGCVHVATPKIQVFNAPVPKLTNANGTPAPTNPSYALATPGPAKVGVPDFFIDKFRIPPFLLPIYQAAGMQYGIRWEVLAGINEIETDYGRNLNVSSAGALGWMQFMPATWKQYGVDANRDGVKDPFNPVDAIFSAARYLKAAGGDTNIRRAIFAYNHADWYVDSVLMRAQVVAGMPTDLVSSLTGLTEGRFPVRARATYADALTKADRRRHGANAAVVVDSRAARKGIRIFARAGAPVVAVNDSKVVRIGRSKRLGRYVVLQDVYGNTYTYGQLKSVAKTYPAPKPKRDTATRSRRHGLAAPEPEAPATKLTRAEARRVAAHPAATPAPAPVTKVRLFAHPHRAPAAPARLAAASSGAPLGLNPKDFVAKRLRKGVQLLGGTTIGRIGRTTKAAPHLLFEIRPAGRGAPRIDPKPILDGWKLLEKTSVYRAKGKNALFGTDSGQPSIGQIMLMGKEALSREVLTDPRISIYPCGRSDIRSGIIDRRVLATLEFLADSGLKPTVTALECGHSYLTTSGNVSEHSTGTAVDIGAINGITITGHQGPGSITDVTIQRLLTLQGTMKPHQIISLMTFKGADNTLALPDHYNHIHIGWRPLYGENKAAARQIDQILKPKQWIKLIGRLGAIDNPIVPVGASKYALKDRPRGSGD